MHANTVDGINVGMWVYKPPEDPKEAKIDMDKAHIDRALHVYTRLQGDQHRPGAPAMPLENVLGWRTAFPHLNSLISGVDGPLDCDIILLEANLELMDGFPPANSHLKVQVDLDFGRPTAGDVSMVSQMDNWFCNTYLYEGGKSMLESRYDVSRPSSTQVKPPFETLWWATRFSQLIQDKRLNEEMGQYHAADERPRHYFRHLTAVQELWASPRSHRMSTQYPATGHGESKRMAILLWKFRQTRSNEVGTTTWRKLIPPPDRAVTNSPRPGPGLGMPLSLDSIAMNRPAPSVYHPPPPQPQDLLPSHGMPQPQPHWPLYQPPQENVGNMFNPTGSLDFLSSITRAEDGLGDRPAVTSVLDPFPTLPHPEPSQPTSLTTSDAPVMLSAPDYSLPPPQLGEYDINNESHYVPSQHVNVQDSSKFLHSILGAGPPPVDDISHSHASWGAPATTLPDVEPSNYTHYNFQSSDHEVPVSREPAHHTNGLEGLEPPDWLEKIVGGVPGIHGAGPDHATNSSYTENVVEAV